MREMKERGQRKREMEVILKYGRGRERERRGGEGRERERETDCDLRCFEARFDGIEKIRDLVLGGGVPNRSHAIILIHCHELKGRHLNSHVSSTPLPHGPVSSSRLMTCIATSSVTTLSPCKSERRRGERERETYYFQ